METRSTGTVLQRQSVYLYEKMKFKYNKVFKKVFVTFHCTCFDCIYCKNAFPTASYDWESRVCNCGKFIRLLANSGLACFVQLVVRVEGVAASGLIWFEDTLN